MRIGVRFGCPFPCPPNEGLTPAADRSDSSSTSWRLPAEGHSWACGSPHNSLDLPTGFPRRPSGTSARALPAPDSAPPSLHRARGRGRLVRRAARLREAGARGADVRGDRPDVRHHEVRPRAGLAGDAREGPQARQALTVAGFATVASCASRDSASQRPRRVSSSGSCRTPALTRRRQDRAGDRARGRDRRRR